MKSWCKAFHIWHRASDCGRQLLYGLCMLAVYMDAEDEQLLEDEVAVPADSKRSVQYFHHSIFIWTVIFKRRGTALQCVLNDPSSDEVAWLLWKMLATCSWACLTVQCVAVSDDGSHLLWFWGCSVKLCVMAAVVIVIFELLLTLRLYSRHKVTLNRLTVKQPFPASVFQLRGPFPVYWKKTLGIHGTKQTVSKHGPRQGDITSGVIFLDLPPHSAACHGVAIVSVLPVSMHDESFAVAGYRVCWMCRSDRDITTRTSRGCARRNTSPRNTIVSLRRLTWLRLGNVCICSIEWAVKLPATNERPTVSVAGCLFV